jgi:hypothetical protein
VSGEFTPRCFMESQRRTRRRLSLHSMPRRETWGTQEELSSRRSSCWASHRGPWCQFRPIRAKDLKTESTGLSMTSASGLSGKTALMACLLFSSVPTTQTPKIPRHYAALTAGIAIQPIGLSRFGPVGATMTTFDQPGWSSTRCKVAGTVFLYRTAQAHTYGMNGVSVINPYTQVDMGVLEVSRTYEQIDLAKCCPRSIPTLSGIESGLNRCSTVG